MPYPLPAETALRLDLARLASEGEVRRLYHGPMTVGEVLERARDQMNEQDRQEAMAADPVAWVRAHRPRRFIDRLLGR